MEFWGVFFFIALIIALGLLARKFILDNVEIVPEGTVAVIERSGKFNRVMNPGRHFLMPLDRARAVVALQEFSETVMADSVITHNATVIGLDMDISYRIGRYTPQKVTVEQRRTMKPIPVIQWNKIQVREKDVFNAVYNVDNWQEKTKREATALMHDFFAMVNLERDIFGNDGAAIKRISQSIREMVNEETLKYGVEVTNVRIYNVDLDEPTRMYLSALKRARQQNELRVLEAESHREIRDRLSLNNEQLLRWFEIQARREAPPVNESNVYFEEHRSPVSLVPAGGPFAAPRPANPQATQPGNTAPRK
jgi:regulator of protease activity HflC (stomatin/prohibitin superfamily)